MSEFSETLSDIIKNNSISIYSLAKTIDCDRTWVQKVVAGERKMNFSNFIALHRELINRIDEKALNNLYEKFIVDYYGEKEWKIIAYIRERLEATKRLELYIKGLNCKKSDMGNDSGCNADCNTDCNTDFNADVMGMEVFDINQYIAEFNLDDDESNIIRNVYEMVMAEFEYTRLNGIIPKLYINIPCEWRCLQNLIIVLLKLANMKGNIDFKYIVNSNSKDNVEIMQLEKFLTSVEFASYGYNTIVSEQTGNDIDSNVIFPYYIVVNGGVAMISEDCRLLVRNDDENVVRQVAEKADMLISDMQNFLKIVNPDTYSSVILSGSFDELKDVYDITNRICVAAFYTKDILKKIVPDYQPNRDFTIETLDMVYEKMREYKLGMYFTIESIRHFMETNDSKQEGQYFNLEFTKEVKIELLSRLYDYYNNGDAEIHMLKTGKYLAGDDIHIFSWSDNIICATGYIFLGDMPVDAMSFVYSPMVAKYMNHYNKYMMYSDICLDKANSLKVLKNLIASYM